MITSSLLWLRSCQIALVHVLIRVLAQLQCSHSGAEKPGNEAIDIHSAVSFSYPRQIMCWCWNRTQPIKFVYMCVSMWWDFIYSINKPWIDKLVCKVYALLVCLFHMCLGILIRIEGRSHYETTEPLQLPLSSPSSLPSFFFFTGERKV